jgi:hypothetical protein
MKYAWLLLALACGGEATGEYVLGTSEQPIFMPYRYGIDGLTNWEGDPDFGMQCEGSVPADFADDQCLVPDSKTIRFKHYASTCPDSTWDSAAVDAYYDWKYEVEAMGWSVVDGTNFQMRCDAGAGGGAMGRFRPGPTWDQHGTSWGTLSQYKDGKITMYYADADAWLQQVYPGSAAYRQIGRINLIKHELYHLVGFGHSQHGAGSDLMSESPNGTWYTYKDLGSTRRTMLDCYNPGSGTSDDC